MIKRIDHFVITTRHLDECLGFYAALGFEAREVKDRYELFGGDFKINVHMAGKELLPHASQISPGSVDICFEVEDGLDAIQVELKKKGVPIEMERSTRHGFFGEMTSIYLRDPDGNLIELSHYDQSDGL